MFLLKAIVVLISTFYVFCKTISDVGIVGGHRIRIEQFPYIASLQINGTHFQCGSSIIHERFILTAAHCISENNTYKVKVGTDNIDEDGQLYDVEKIFKHENFTLRNIGFDICVIKLKKALTFGPKVAKISLNDGNIKLENGTSCNATGWGVTKYHGSLSKELQQVEIPLISLRNCQHTYWPHLPPQMICAGGNGKDTCLGDSGGPLTVQDVQIGITSFGEGCGILPGAYVNISIFKSWIDAIIAQNI